MAVARAVINHPALLLADEPTAALDDAHAQATLELLHTQAHAVGATLVVASHDARVRPLLPRAFALPLRAEGPLTSPRSRSPTRDGAHSRRCSTCCCSPSAWRRSRW